MMKKNRYIINILVLIACAFLLPVSVTAQFTETKEFREKFKVNPDTRIEISNKYGKVELNTWEKDSVVIEVKIKVEEKKLSKLEKAIDAIDFDFTQSQHFVIARTLVGQNRSNLEKEFLRFKESIFQSEGKMTIDYEVWLPANNELKVENKFGDIYIGDYEGDVDINLSNGNLKSHDFKGKVEMKLSFADATINTIETANLDCNFSELYIKNAQSLDIESRSSKFEIIEIGEIKAESRRDNFRIRLIDMLEARGSFSNFRIGELTDRLKLRAEYGDIDVEQTAEDFSNLFIESKSTDVNLYFNEESNFDFEISHDLKTELSLCSETKIEDEQSIDEKETKLIGSFGETTSPDKRLTIKAYAGEVNIFSN